MSRMGSARLKIMDSFRHSHPVVLYVEDSAEDFALFERASKKCGTPFSLHRAADGEQAIAYLGAEDPYNDRDTYPFPDLVLLDLRMPRLDGFEVLQWIRTNPATRSLPVVVLAGSTFRADIRRALELGANHYAAKPGGFAELQVLIDQIADVWLAREKAGR
jgi:CheY-like chemotaxis protein